MTMDEKLEDLIDAIETETAIYTNISKYNKYSKTYYDLYISKSIMGYDFEAYITITDDTTIDDMIQQLKDKKENDTDNDDIDEDDLDFAISCYDETIEKLENFKVENHKN